MKRPTRWYLLQEQSRDDVGYDDKWADFIRMHPDGEFELGQQAEEKRRPIAVEKGTPDMIAELLEEKGYQIEDVEQVVNEAAVFRTIRDALAKVGETE